VPWLPEDNVTLRYIEDTIEIELHDNDSTLQGKIKGPADIENVLQARWEDLLNFPPQTLTRKIRHLLHYLINGSGVFLS
jgi:hypothetical protein